MDTNGFCLDKNVTYAHRVDNPTQWSWCSVPDGGFDAVFFAGMAIVVMCMASTRWDALISLVAGGIYQYLAWEHNLGHVSNAVNLWLSMRPADIFVFVFLPPLLLDCSVRLDFFLLKKVIVHVMLMAFVMVITTCLVLIPFMLYVLDLKSSGWDGGYVALFGAAIASTDAASVVAALAAGGAPEMLAVLLEGESLFNDASSLTLFAIFREVVTHQSKGLAGDIADIAVMTLQTALIGVAVGIGMGIFTKWFFVWLQRRNMPPHIEVAFSVGGAYLSFYITQVFCKGSGCVGTVVYGIYGSATLLWGMSSKTRQSGIFQYFWVVMTFLVNALIFFFVGASCVNFTIRSSDELNEQSGIKELLSVTLYKLPFIYLYVFGVRVLFVLIVFQPLRMLKVKSALTWQECLFLTFGGLRGSLSLVLAQTMVTLASTDADTTKANRVKSEAAMYTAGFVIMTMIINAPLLGPVMTLLRLNKVSKEQLQMRSTVKHMFYQFTETSLDELQAEAEEDELLQGVDWSKVKADTDFQEVLDKHMPEEQPRVNWLGALYPGWARKTVGFFRSCFTRLTVGPQSSSQTADIVEYPDLEPNALTANLAGDKDLARVTVWRAAAFELPQAREPPQERNSPFLIIKVDDSQASRASASVPFANAAGSARSHTRSKSFNANAQNHVYDGPIDNDNRVIEEEGQSRSKARGTAMGNMTSQFLKRMSTAQHMPTLTSSMSQGGGLAAPGLNKSNSNSRDPSLRAGNGFGPKASLPGPTDDDFARAMAKALVATLSQDSSGISAPLDAPSVDPSKVEVELASTSNRRETSPAPDQLGCVSAGKLASLLDGRTPASSMNALPDLGMKAEQASSPKVASPRAVSAKDKDSQPAATSTQQAPSADRGFFEDKATYSFNSLVVITAGRKGTGDVDVQEGGIAISSRASITTNAMLQEAMCEQNQANPGFIDDMVVQRVAPDGLLATVSMQVRPVSGRDRPNLSRISNSNMQPALRRAENSLSRQSGGPFGSGTLPESNSNQLGRSSVGYSWSSTPKHGIGEDGSPHSPHQNDMPLNDVMEEPGDLRASLSKAPSALGRMSAKRSTALSGSSRFMNQQSQRLGSPAQSSNLSKRGTRSESAFHVRDKLGRPEPSLDITAPAADSDAMLTECRLRLLTGLEQHFKQKYTEGILSGQSYKTLSYVTSKSQEEPWRPVRLWELTEREVSTGTLLKWEAHVYYRLKAWSNRAKSSHSFWHHRLVTWLLALPIWLLSWHLSSVQLAGLETVVQLWISLTDSLQTQWLMFAGQYGAMVIDEVNENAEAAWKYIVDRRIETPEKFQAVQTYRACVSLLSHQLTFVHELSHGGMIDEKEAERMEDAMQRKLQEVCRAGPQWRPQKIGEILGATPFVRNIDPVFRNDVAKFLRKSANIYVYKEGECIWEHWSSQHAPPGMFIVLRGVVEMKVQAGDRQQSVYLGSGGMGGLLGLVLNDVVPGVGPRAAYASGTALGKGPSVLYLRREVFEHIQMLSREQRLPMFQHLELSLFKTAAGLVVDLLKAQIMSQLGMFVCSAIAACITSQKWDSRVAKRQHIRAIFSDALDADTVEGTINPMQIDWVNELLSLPKDVALALLDGRLDKEVATAPWHKAMFQAIAAATKSVYEMIRGCIRESWLIHLRPGQTIWQTSTMLLMQGSLKAGSMPEPPVLASTSFTHQGNGHVNGGQHADNGAVPQVLATDLGDVTPSDLHLPGGGLHVHPLAPRVSNQDLGTINATPNAIHEAPSVMVWTADYFTAGAPEQPPIAITAGSKGASLLVWGLDTSVLVPGVSQLHQA